MCFKDQEYQQASKQAKQVKLFYNYRQQLSQFVRAASSAYTHAHICVHILFHSDKPYSGPGKHKGKKKWESKELVEEERK